MKQSLSGLSLLLAATLAGCATGPAPEESTGEAAPEPEPALAIHTTPEMFADLLVAEVAAQRNALGVTLAYYSRVAKHSNDPEVIAQAARLASYLEEHQQALELSQLWLKQSPDNEKAHEVAALAAISLGEPDQAASHIDQLMGDDPRRALAELVGRARGLDQKGNEQLLAALSSLVERYPDQAPLWYARALHLQNNNETEQALQACNRALEEDPTHQEAMLLKARLLDALDRDEEALAHIRKVVKGNPGMRRARGYYIRLLITTGHEGRAADELERLAEDFPDTPDLRFSLALFALEQDAPELGGEVLSSLLEAGYRVDDMHLYLGQAAEMAGDRESAIEHFLAVNNGDQRFRARIQAARLLYETDRGERADQLLADLRDHNPGRTPTLYAAQAEMLSRSDRNPAALELLNQALSDLPDNTELLYARAMIAERMDKLGQLEADLRRVLEIKPGDPVALNALGYTLADHDLRLGEAREYIEKALEKQPENPAFIDSMGWLLYREGKLEEARDWLARAWEKLNDAEIAAHYGEVLWQLGNRDKARDVWQQAVEEHPDNEPLRETMQRFLEPSP